MAKLIYIANVSLDGYIEDRRGRFDWTAPSDEFFTFITGLVRPVGTYLLGRRMYETMAVWETQPALAAQSELMADFANVWQAADKIVYSTTLQVVSTAATRPRPELTLGITTERTRQRPGSPRSHRSHRHGTRSHD